MISAEQLATREEDLPARGSIFSDARAIIEGVLMAFLVILPWLILFAAIPPADQEFCMSDEWAYARGAYALLRGEGPHYYGLASMPVLGQWLWSIGFIKLFGPSRIVLRLSTLALSFLGLAAFHQLLQQEGIPRGRSALATLAVAWSPYYMMLSGSFMTDVPGLCSSLIALAFYAHALSTGRTMSWIGAMLAAIFGAATRQNTVAAPLAACIFLLMMPERRRQPVTWVACTIPLAIAAGVHYWMRFVPDTVPLGPHVPSPQEAGMVLFLAVIYGGLFTLPVLLWPGPRWGWDLVLCFVLSLTVLGGFAFWLYQSQHLLFPYLTVPWLPEADLGIGNVPPLYNLRALRMVLTVAASVGGSALVTRAMALLKSRGPRHLLILFSAIHLLILAASPVLLDRYFVVFLPGSVYVAIATSRSADRVWLRWRAIAAGTLVLASGAVSIGVTHDWYATHVARWALGNRGIALGLKSGEIEGGFAWDYWHSSVTNWNNYSQRPGYKYAIASEHFPSTQILDRQPYRLWLSGGTRWFYLLGPRADSEARFGSAPSVQR
jgi:hypothetical protein